MFNRMKPIRASLVVLFVVATLSACGGGTTTTATTTAKNGGDAPLSGSTVARVGKIAVTTSLLDHWMPTLMGGDFYELTHVKAPPGLVSEPANYRHCESGLKALVPSLAGQALATHCRDLYVALREQAVSYLLNADVEIEQAAEQGITVGQGEVEQSFDRLKAEQFPAEAEVQKYLADRNWSLSDELFLVKRNLLGTRLLAKVRQKLGGQGEQALDAFYRTNGQKWTEQTACRAGYVVIGCRNYTSPASPYSPALLIEQLDVHPNTPTAPDLECRNGPHGKLACEPTSQKQ